MPVIFTRVDDRLIHGQVTQGWLPSMKTDEVVVAMPHCGGFKMAALMRLALPAQYGLKHGTPKETAGYLKTAAAKIFLLVFSLKELEELIDEGVEIKTANIGGIHFAEGKTEVHANFFLSAEEKEILKRLHARGVAFECKAVPKDSDFDVMKKI